MSDDTDTTIPHIDARALFDATHGDHHSALDQVNRAVSAVGFMRVTNTGITAGQITSLIDTYRTFFRLPVSEKAAVDMAATGSNRGWGAPGAEQVSPSANPDFKQVFDCGPELQADDPLLWYTYYAPNRWPSLPPGFRETVMRYYREATGVSLALLSAIARAIGEPADYFDDAFDKPMALLRGNYYPPRPADAGRDDFGIAPHTDYGCLTLLATDGSEGLEVQSRDDRWMPVSAEPGTFVINFGEMLQHWTAGRVRATSHRVVGSHAERLSVPFFFNPRFDVNVAPIGSGMTLLAGDHLARRYDDTYVHRQSKSALPAR